MDVRSGSLKYREGPVRKPMGRIRVDDLHKKWMKNSKYRREYEAVEEEFSRVATLIEARTRAGLTQERAPASEEGAYPVR